MLYQLFKINLSGSTNIRKLVLKRTHRRYFFSAGFLPKLQQLTLRHLAGIPEENHYPQQDQEDSHFPILFNKDYCKAEP